MLALGAACAAWAGQPVDGVGDEHRSKRSLGDGIADTPLEYDRRFKAGHQHGTAEGHLPASNRNVALVGKLRVSGAAPGRIADVASLGNFAYLGAFQEPDCQRTGVYVIDVSNPRAPTEAGFIPTTPGFYVGEGVQALHLDTPRFRGDLLVHNNEPCATLGPGGMSLWDVSDPRQPKPLARHVGDPDVTPPANAIHSAFAWQQGNRAFAVQVDDYETESGDVDIFDITDPTRPVQIAEVGVDDWPDARNAFEPQSWGLGEFPASFHHDVQVRNVGGQWRMLISYWDAGYVVLDVNDPANPQFVADSDFPGPDPLTGLTPEGNAHYAEWDRTGRYVLAADEDFTPEGVHGRITTGAFARGLFDPDPVGETPQVDHDNPLTGPTYFVGTACTPLAVPAAPSSSAIAVIERGDCNFQLKLTNVELAGYHGGIIFNRAPEGGEDPQNSGPAGPCEVTFSPSPAVGVSPFLFVARSAGFRILGIPGYDATDCGTAAEPNLPAPGTQGSDVDVGLVFDGWGYMRLLDASSLREVDSYAIPEALDGGFASGAGWLTIHETAADPTHDIAYVSWYDGGFRVAAFDGGDLREVGHYIDQGGNDFWGVQVHVTPDCERLVLASDRDYGLYIFRYLGVPARVPCPGVPARASANRGRCANRIRGTNRRDRLRGTPGGDRIDALRGNDRASGLGGRDCLYGRQGSDRLSGGTGGDRLYGSSGNDRLYGGSAGDRLSGGFGRDLLAGGSGRDVLRAAGGGDRLSGGGGHDRISVGTGGRKTSISGGAGNDSIKALNARGERIDCGPGRDVVRADRTDRTRRCERVVRPRRSRR